MSETTKRRRIVTSKAATAIAATTRTNVLELPRRVSLREVGAGIAVEVLEQGGRRFARIIGARGGAIRPVVVVESKTIDPLVAALGAVAGELGGAR